MVIVKSSVAAINLSICFTVASPIKLQFMSRGYVQAEIKLKLNPKFDIKLQTELDRRGKKGSSDEPPAKATRSETGKASQKKPPVKERIQAKSSTVPKDQAQWVGRGLAIASHFNLNDINEVLKLNKYVFAHGQWEVFPTPKNGSCMFAAFRRGLEAPEEFRNCHLRYMVALFLCQNADFMFDILETHIAASYGMDRLTPEQYKKAQEEDTLTPDQEEAQHLPGPFSYAGYVEALLDESFWGDHGVLLAISMMWQVTITALTAETFTENWICHSRGLADVDFLLLYCGGCHYLGTCKYNLFVNPIMYGAVMVWGLLIMVQ